MSADILDCLLRFLMYIIPCVIIFLPLRFITRIPGYVFRKILHMIAFTCTTLMIAVANTWQAAALTSILIAVCVYPLLAWAERMPWYSRLFVEKKPGEIKKSLLLLFFMFAGVTAAAWGIFGRPDIAAVSILMWGTGDGAAALTGIPYGKHKIRWKGTDGKKSYEGTSAFILVSLTAGTVFFQFYEHIAVRGFFLPVCGAAIAGALTELYSDSVYDTVTVPVMVMTVLLLWMR